ncbi:hypothetical protein [Alicyclobacillus fastidiosus]|uniref:Resolvase/invertase-type recombinase catalytic domain-containing protein n=1 Tax=Alicyclobacillus fastidiosus TaxID=392011 RepID=A0ABV5AJ99_9BACL|nr:hypothetical protein [Alicyclobacillus fastidiosus]WEH09130.1 hypothetical protein PYS47_21035 [Alicyclobacillus fastidiosus]
MSIKAIGYTRSSIESHEALVTQLMAIHEYCLKRGHVLDKNCMDTSDTCSDLRICSPPFHQLTTMSWS